MSSSSLGSLVLTVTITLLLLTTLVIIMRFISRRVIKRKFSLDDWLMLLAWALIVGLSISIVLAAFSGLGLHSNQLQHQQKVNLKKVIYAVSVLYVLQPSLHPQVTHI